MSYHRDTILINRTPVITFANYQIRVRVYKIRSRFKGGREKGRKRKEGRERKIYLVKRDFRFKKKTVN